MEAFLGNRYDLINPVIGKVVKLHVAIGDCYQKCFSPLIDIEAAFKNSKKTFDEDREKNKHDINIEIPKPIDIANLRGYPASMKNSAMAAIGGKDKNEDDAEEEKQSTASQPIRNSTQVPVTSKPVQNGPKPGGPPSAQNPNMNRSPQGPNGPMPNHPNTPSQRGPGQHPPPGRGPMPPPNGQQRPSPGQQGMPPPNRGMTQSMQQVRPPPNQQQRNTMGGPGPHGTQQQRPPQQQGGGMYPSFGNQSPQKASVTEFDTNNAWANFGNQFANPTPPASNNNISGFEAFGAPSNQNGGGDNFWNFDSKPMSQTNAFSAPPQQQQPPMQQAPPAPISQFQAPPQQPPAPQPPVQQPQQQQQMPMMQQQQAPKPQQHPPAPANPQNNVNMMFMDFSDPFGGTVTPKTPATGINFPPPQNTMVHPPPLPPQVHQQPPASAMEFDFMSVSGPKPVIQPVVVQQQSMAPQFPPQQPPQQQFHQMPQPPHQQTSISPFNAGMPPQQPPPPQNNPAMGMGMGMPPARANLFDDSLFEGLPPSLAEPIQLRQPNTVGGNPGYGNMGAGSGFQQQAPQQQNFGFPQQPQAPQMNYGQPPMPAKPPIVVDDLFGDGPTNVAISQDFSQHQQQQRVSVSTNPFD
jgi:hypothetical protein